MNSSLFFDQFISNIQEIDIEWMFELTCMFVGLFFVLFFCLFILIPNDHEKRKSTVKQEKVLNYYYYCAIVKYICLFFDQLTSYLPNQVYR